MVVVVVGVLGASGYHFTLSSGANLKRLVNHQFPFPAEGDTYQGGARAA